MEDSKDQKTDGTSSSVRTRNESRERSSTDMPVLSRSNSRNESKADSQPHVSNPDAKEKAVRSDSRERSRSEHSSKIKEPPQNVTRAESHDRSTKADSRKSDSKKSDSKSTSKSFTSPDKKSKQEHSKSADGDKKSKTSTSALEPEHKEPIKVKISLSQIRSYNPIGTGDDSNDSDGSFDGNVDYERKRGKRKDGSSGKKKRSKEKSRRSKNAQQVDTETLAPPELELMETGDSGVAASSDLDAGSVDPEPLSLPEEMEVDNVHAGSFNDEEEEHQQRQPTSGKICSFCACGEKSLLGQGDMCRYDPTPGFNPFRRPVQKSKKSAGEAEEKGPDRGPKALTSRRQRGPLKRDSVKGPRRGPDDDMCEGFDELATVGFPEDTEMGTVFEPSGHTWAHHCCAAWSEGVIQNEDCVLKYVDKAVVSGLSKKCNYCYRYGATINCQRCNKVYHYPCASGGGCFQDIKSLSLLCPDHTGFAQTIAGEEADCNMCNQVGNISEQLFCTSCGHHYHGSCLIPPVEINPTVRAGWQCPDCKICQMCRQPGDDSKMLVCDLCDKGYHTFCLRPVMTTIPKNGWKCKNCRVCEDCRSRTPGSGRSSRWHLNYTVCDSCYQQRNKGLCCPICGKAYRHFSQKAMVQCNLCKKLVHSECDDTIDTALHQQAKNEEATDYTCPICKYGESEMVMPDFPTGIPQVIEDSSDSVDNKGMLELESGEDSSQHSSQMVLNEDSLSSMDVDMTLLGKMSPSYMIPGREGEVGLGKGKLVAIARKKMSLASKTKSRTLSGEKRKRPITFGEKRRGPKPKIHAAIGSSSSKKTDDDDDDDDHPNTIILANKSDIFTFDQDVCKSCGSFGKGEEGRLIGCTQCGQCYHPYCANIKVTKIMIQKGWRCLDCTVCEGCGKNHDEGRLLLCDECDISFHTYCLDPPLDHVPKGTWKCKWCVVCLICNSKSPGFGCHWQNNYTHCGPCESKISCPSCRCKYMEDELVIQCVQCDRWLHAACDGIYNEDDAERAADFGYHCHFCRPRTGQPGPLPLPPPPPAVQEDFFLPAFPAPFVREPEPPKYCYLDGIWITQQAKKNLEKTMMEAPKIKRNRRWGKKPDGWDERRGEIENKIKELVAEKHLTQDGAAPERSTPALTRLLSVGSVEDEDKEEELKSPDEGDLGVQLKELEQEAIRRLNEEKKTKKKRNVTKIGVGGFVVKPRFKPKVKKQGSEGAEGLEEGMIPRPLEGEESIGSLEEEKPRKWQRKVPGRRKSQLQENFPSYMQEAFFGGEILTKSRESMKETLKSLDSDEEKSPVDRILSELPVKEESSIEISAPIKKQLQELPRVGLRDSDLIQDQDKRESPSNILDDPFQLPDSANGDQDDGLLGIGDIDDNFIKMIESELAEDGIPTELLNEVEQSPTNEPEESNDQTDDPARYIDDKNVLADFPMISDALTHIDSKDVEDMLKGVLQGGQEGDQAPKRITPELDPAVASPSGAPQTQPHPGIPSSVPEGHPGLPEGLKHLPPSQTGALPTMGPLPSHSMGQQAPQKPPMLRLPPPDGGFVMPLSSPGIPPDVMRPMPGFPPEMDQRQIQQSPQFPPGFMQSWPQGVQDNVAGQDSSRRNMLKWESDEDLGNEATISPILYCNIIHPELKEQYPDWSERSKQIAKIWRKLTPDQKQPYLLKARKNRGNIKAKAKPVTKKSDGMMQGHMPVQPPDMFSSPEGQHSPNSMQSPLRPGSQMVPGTPEGQSPNHPSPGHGIPPFPGSQPDPYHRMPPTPRSTDPYAMPPPTPRPASGGELNPQHLQQRGGPPGHEMFSPSPTGQKSGPGDPYSQPPSTPRPDHGVSGDQYGSPIRGGTEFSPSPGTGHAPDSYSHVPGIQRSQPNMGPRPPLQHQPSWPGHDPEGPDRTPSGPFAPGMPRHARPPLKVFIPSRQLSEPGMHPGASTADDQFPFSASTPASDHFGVSRSDALMTSAGDPYSQPPGTPLPHLGERFPRPRLPIRQHSVPVEGSMMPGGQFRPPMRHPHMRPPMIDPYSQQPGTPHPRMEPPMRYPLQMMAEANRRNLPFPRTWPPHIAHNFSGMNPNIPKEQVREILAMKSLKNIGERQGEGEMLPPGSFQGMRQPRPQLPGFQQIPNLGPGDMKKALQEKIKAEAAKMGYIPAGQQPQGQPRGPTPSSGASEESLTPKAPQPSPGGQAEDQAKQGEKKALAARAHKQSLSEDDIKPDDTDELGDFLSADGTFDILKYADPDLDLLDNKTIFDDLVEDTKPDESKKTEKKEEEKTEPKTETEGEEKTDTEKKDFQAKFLEFSQRKQPEGSTTEPVKTEGGKKQEPGAAGQPGGVGHIAALLQNRPQSVKSEGGESTESQKAARTPTTPGTPMTPSDQASLRPGQYPPGVPSPHGMYGLPSPSGLPSPKVMPSPKSQPSPRTPGEPQIAQQQSPFSQHSTHSPFSPQATTPTSAPQSPYSVKTQSPFAVPGTNSQSVTAMLSQGSPAQPSYSPAHTPPMTFPMQRSPRASVPQGPPFMQGPFPHQGPMAGARGLVPNQPPHSFSQMGLRPGIRPPTSLPVSQQPPGTPGDLASPGIRGMHPRPPFPGHPASSPGKPGQIPSQMYPGMPGLRPGAPGQPSPGQAFISQQMIVHGQIPGTTVTASSTVTSTTLSTARTTLLEDQPLLIQDLLEQEKLEQQKRQHEQQQAMLRREGGIRPEGMMGPRPGAPGMVPMGPAMPPRMEGPVRHPQAGGMFAQPDMPGMRPRMPAQLSPHSQSFGLPSPQGQIGGPMMPPKPPTPGETGPEAERQHIQYEHWLMKHGEALEGHIKFLEQQIQKQKRTKKAINARNRQAKKNGQEMPPQDAMELERASQEQSVLQKQLEQVRKQNRQHQISIQEYRAKQQERINHQMMQQGQQPTPGAIPITGPVPISSAVMQPPPPRMPGSQGSARLTPSKRMEYDAYMQNRLQQMGQGLPPRGVPRPPGMPPQPRMAIVDNNPFSDTYQQRELQGSQNKPVGGKPDEGTESQYRYPPGSMEGQQPWIQQRFPFDPAVSTVGQRMPGPEQRFPGPYPPQQPPAQPPPPQSFPQTTDTQTPAAPAPQGKVAPVTFKPQDETERRIMEILNSTANMQRAQSPGTATTVTTTASSITAATTTTTTAVTATQPTVSQSEPPIAVSSVQPQTPPNNQSGSRPPSVPLAKTPPTQGRQTPGTHPGLGGRLTPGQAVNINSPNPPVSVQAAAASAPTSLPPMPVTHTMAASERVPASAPSSSHMAQVHMQVPMQSGLQNLPVRGQLPGMPPGVSSPGNIGSVSMGLPQRHPIPQGQHPNMHGQTAGFPGHPRPPGFPAHLRHMRPEIAAQLQQQQLQGFPHFDPMQGHPMQRPPVLPHWVAPGTSASNNSQARRSPRPIGPGMNTMVRMGIPRTRFAGQEPNQQVHHGMLSQGMPPTSQIHGSVPAQGQVRPLHPELVNQLPVTSIAVTTTATSAAMLVKRVELGPQGDLSNISHNVKSEIPKVTMDKDGTLASQPTVSVDQGTSSNPQTIMQPNVVKQPSPCNLSNEGSEKQIGSSQDQNAEQKKECIDGKHYGTPPHGECTDGTHCGTPPTSQCKDGIHCGTPPPSDCTDGIHCGTPPPNDCTDGVHCGTPPPSDCTDGVHCGTPPLGECTDGIHCGTPPPGECTDGIHCGTPPPGECTDGIHCGTPPPSDCKDGIHCGTPPPSDCTDGVHCGTPPPEHCTDGIHCGTPPPSDCKDGIHCGTPPPSECTDGIHCGTPPPSDCTDGVHCGTPPPGQCTDGIHCGTPPPSNCTDGIHCGTPPPSDCTDGVHCGTPPPEHCTDGIHCGTPPPSDCTDGIHCGTPPPNQCTDGIHCGTPPPEQCTDGIHCGTPPPNQCTDGIHCGTPPPEQCTDGIHCGTPPPNQCSDGIHCGTPPPDQCTDGIHCGTPPAEEGTDETEARTTQPSKSSDQTYSGTSSIGDCTDGIHCGTPPPQENEQSKSDCDTQSVEGQCAVSNQFNLPSQEESMDCSDGPATIQNATDTEDKPPCSGISVSEMDVDKIGESDFLADSRNELNIHTDVQESHRPPDSKLLSPQQLAIQADHQYVNIAQIPTAVKPKPVLSDQEKNTNEESSVLSSITPSNVTITSSPKSAFSNPNVHDKDHQPSKEPAVQPDVQPQPTCQSVSSNLTSDVIVKLEPVERISKQETQESKNIPILSTQHFPHIPHLTTSIKANTESVESTKESSNEKAINEPISTQHASSHIEKHVPDHHELLPTVTEPEVSGQIKVKQESDGQKPLCTMSSSNTNLSQLTDTKPVDNQSVHPTLISTSEMPSVSLSQTTLSQAGAHVPLQLTSVPRPQYFGPIPRFPGEQVHPNEQKRFPQPNRHYPQGYQGLPRMDLRAQYPSHSTSNSYPHGGPRHFMTQHQSGSLEHALPEGQLRPGGPEIRPWRAGMDPRLRLPVQVPRMTDPNEMSKTEANLTSEPSQRYTLHDPEFNGPPAGRFPGHGQDMRPMTSLSGSTLSGVQESRYQLQHMSPDPRYTMTSQHEMRLHGPRAPGQFIQGHSEMRHPYPGQFPPYFQQRHPGLQRFMRPEHMMQRHPLAQGAEQLAPRLPLDQQLNKTAAADVKPDLKLNVGVTSIGQTGNSVVSTSQALTGVSHVKKADAGTGDTTVMNIKVEPQAPGSVAQHSSSTPPANTPPTSQTSTPQPSPAHSAGSQRATPQPIPSPAQSAGSQGMPSHPSPSGNSQRSSPAQSHSPGRSAVPSPHDDLPSVSATFAAAGMNRLSENILRGQGPFIGQRPPMPNIGSASSGFSSVSSIVQSVSTVSFPSLAGQSTTQASTVAQTPPTEIALPPSTVVKSEALAAASPGAAVSTQTPVHNIVPPTSQVGEHVSRLPIAVTTSTTNMSIPSSMPPSSILSNVPAGPHGSPSYTAHMPQYHGPQGTMTGPQDHMGTPRMFAPRPGMHPVTSAGQPPGPRAKGQRQPYGHQGHPRFPNMPSNLPPHLAGMLTGMRGPPIPRQSMYPHQQAERHPGMPMGPMRFPPGHPMSVAPGGPRAYPIPHSVNADGVPNPMSTSSGMMMSPAGRHPGMMHPGMHGMRHPGAMRPTAPGGPVGHPMQQMHPGQISPQISPQMSPQPQMSPTSHPGAPHMHPGIHPPTSGMMGPPGYPQHMGSQPSEMASPTRHPGAPLTPGSVPSTPSPTPASYSPGMLPPVSSTIPQTSLPGFHGEMTTRPQFPYHRMPGPGQRIPYDPRMGYDHSIGHMNSDIHRPPGAMPRFPTDLHHPMIHNRGPSPNIPPSLPAEESARLLSMGVVRGTSVTTPPLTGSASVTPPLSGSDTRPSSTSSIPTIKQEPDADLPASMDPAQNALLKKLLAKNNAAMAAAMASGQTTPQSDHSEDSNDFSNIQLTPEQQRQLELIEKMPLTTKRTLPEPDLIPDITDPDLEAKRQEYERRRKEMEESRKNKRKNPDGTPRKKKKKKDATEPAMKQPVPGVSPFQTLGPFDPQQMMNQPMNTDATSPLQSPDKDKKKGRIRKKKEKALDIENIETILETFNQQLKLLPAVPLMEPFVGHSYAICTLAGASSNINGDSLVSGAFGKTNMTNQSDFYEDLLTGTPSISELMSTKDIAERRKLISDGKQDVSDEQRYRLMMENIRNESGLRSSPPFGFGSLGMPRGSMPALPPHPRVEPRIQIPKTTDSPESVISSSSPEVGFGEQDNVDYPMLRPIDLPAEDDETRTSPTMPLLQPVPVKYPPFLLKQEVPTEAEKQLVEAKDAPIPTHKGKQELDSALLGLAGKDSRMAEMDPLTGLPRTSKDSNADTEVSVTLTLSAKAAEDIGGVLSAIADLLKIAAPPTYEVSRSPSPEQFKSNVKHKEETLNIQSLNKNRSAYCKHCDVAFVNAGIRKKKSELSNLTKEELESEEDMMIFCSQPCLLNFKNTRLLTHKPDDMDITDQTSLLKPNVKELGMMSPGEVTPSSSATATPAATPSSGIEPMEITPTKSGPPTPQLGSPTSLMRQKSELEKFGKSKFRRSGSITEMKPQIKKWKDIKYRRFEPGYFSVMHTVEKKEENEAENWTKLIMSITHNREKVEDKRMCEFCQQNGDGEGDGVSRLLNMDIDKWAHLNCALWSQDVYETLNGALMNVQQAFKKASKQKCVLCLKTGASLQCFKSRCNNIYHVPCAQLVGCTFFEDKTIYCPPHSQKGGVLDQVLKSLIVYRKVYINRDEDAQVANMYLQEDGQHTLRIGSLVLHTIGQLLPHQMAGGKFNNRDFLYPVGYKCTRFYWSLKTLYKRCRYICTIQEKDGRPEFVVTVTEEGQKDVVLQHSSCTGVWKYILDPLETLHKEADLVKIFPGFTSGEELYGLTDPNIIRLIESLPGTDLLKDYVFKFGRRQLIDLPLTINPTGCARTEPKLRTHFRKPHTLQSSSTHSLPSTVTGLTGDLNSPYMKHFVHSKSQQYRRLKTEWKNLVYLGRSRIQGLGLYAAKDLEMHTMVIEYIGDLIRNEVANHREKIYEDQNRGVYMFRIDNDTVVDATMAGGPARYINHSCDPNCVAEVVEIDKESKIIIITNRRIQKGEELCYDYHFDEEDMMKKIPCGCGAWNCRKWMN